MLTDSGEIAWGLIGPAPATGRGRRESSGAMSANWRGPLEAAPAFFDCVNPNFSRDVCDSPIGRLVGPLGLELRLVAVVKLLLSWCASIGGALSTPRGSWCALIGVFSRSRSGMSLGEGARGVISRGLPPGDIGRGERTLGDLEDWRALIGDRGKGEISP